MKCILSNDFKFPQLQAIPVENMVKTPGVLNCNRCPKKNRKLAMISSYCYEHFFQAQALRHFNTVSVAKQLESMFLEQGGLCYFTRQLLIPGSPDPEHQPSLDHLMPVSRGGTSTIENIRWVTKRANTLKQNMTKEELLSVAIQIANRNI